MCRCRFPSHNVPTIPVPAWVPLTPAHPHHNSTHVQAPVPLSQGSHHPRARLVAQGRVQAGRRPRVSLYMCVCVWRHLPACLMHSLHAAAPGLDALSLPPPPAPFPPPTPTLRSIDWLNARYETRPFDCAKAKRDLALLLSSLWKRLWQTQPKR